MPDDTNTYLVPWIFQGIDRTTQRRLRLPREFVESLSGLKEGLSASVRDEQLQRLREFFSSREFALVKELRIAPFLVGERLVATFLVVDSESSPRDGGYDLGLIEAAASAIATKIDQSRAVFGQGGGRTNESMLRSHLIAILRESRETGMQVTIARVDLAKLATDLIPESTRADLYRFQRDLAGALTAMVAGAGELFSLGEHTVLLIVQSRKPYSEQLLVHQFGQGMRTLLSDAPPVGHMVERISHFPNSERTIDEVVDSVLE